MRRVERSFSLFAVGVGLALAGCPGAGGGLPEVVDVRDVSSAGGAPSIVRVLDIGTGTVPERGPLAPATSDGTAVIGELLLVQGSGFGKQPRVSIGGRATEVLGHVSGGGVVVRVPWGIDPGQVEIEVTHRAGRGSATFPVRRLGLVLTVAGLETLEVKADGGVTRLGSRLPLAGGQKLAFSHDGSVAYVGGTAGGKVKLWFVDLTASPPRIAGEQSVPGSRLLGLAASEQSDLGAVVTDSHVVYFDNRRMLNPSFYTPHKLPEALVKKGILAAAMGGRGKTLALLLADLNQVAVIDTSRPTALPPAVVVDALPEVRLQVVRDLRVSADGTSVWVLSSDTARSIAGGYQPVRLTLVRVSVGDERKLEVHQTWELGEKQSAAMLALARGEPIPPGTSIHTAPSTSSVYFPVHHSDLLKQGFSALLKGSWTGKVIRSSLSQTSGETIAEGPWLLTALDVAGQTEVLLALGCAVKGGRPVRVLVHGRAWRGGPPATLELDPLAPDVLAQSPPWLGVVRAQP
jgi:hypothetical protein